MNAPESRPDSSGAPPPRLSAREQYNVVSDTVVGVNVRWRDNVFQAVVIVGCATLGAGIGWRMAGEDDVRGPVLLGALGGLVAGTLLSGAALMVFRFVRHVRGRHD
jgi:hypothetical protein